MQKQKDLLVLVSKTSGAQKDVTSDIKAVLKESSFVYDIKRVTSPPEIATILKKEKANYKAVAVYGGDGSVISAIKSLVEGNTKLIILPGGTGNILATNLQLPMNPTDLIQMYIDGSYTYTTFDLAKLNDSMMAYDLYIGWWASATKQLPREVKKKFGQIAYGISALKTYKSAQKQRYEFTVDGKQKKINAYTIIIANRNAQHFLGLELFPHKHRPGVLNIAAVKNMSFWSGLIWLMGRTFTNKNLGNLLKTYRGNEVVLTKAPNDLLFDDLDQKVTLPCKIVGDRYETTLIIPPEVQKISTQKRYVLFPQLLYVRIKERMRNYFVGQPSYRYAQFAPNLYVGGRYKPVAYDLFKRWGVTGIINMRKTKPEAAPRGFKVLHLQTTDWTAPSLEALNNGVKFIEQQLTNGGGVYIHCRQGIGRGPTMAAAYLISKGLSVDEAIKHIKRSRPLASPSRSQTKRLVDFQTKYNSSRKL